MKIDISLPFLTKGQPKRCNSIRDIYVTMPITVDVPEIARDETEVAFKTHGREVVFSNPDTGRNEIAKVQAEYEIRAYEGRLYRKRVGIDQLKNTAFNVAFDTWTEPRQEDVGTAISVDSEYNGVNPLAAPLRRQIEWDLEKTSLYNSNVVVAWPTASGLAGRARVRAAAEFPTLAPTIQHLNGELCELSHRRIEKQASKLLVIGEELWVESRPPAWRVRVVENWVTIDLAVVIEGFDPILSRRHFPLDRLDDAKAYAKLCAKKRAAEPDEYTISECLVDYDAYIPELLAFDADAEELARIGYALAAECMRYGRDNNVWMQSLSEELRGSLFAAHAATMETDLILGQVGDVAPYVHDLCAVWRSFNRPLYYCEVGPARARFGDMMMKRVRALAENAPISIGSVFGTIAGAKP